MEIQTPSSVFENIIEPLEKLTTALEDDVKDKYYSRLKRFTPDVIRRAVDKVIDNHESGRFPFVSILVKMAYAVENEGKRGSGSIFSYCPECQATGVLRVKLFNGDAMMTRCDCQAGEQYKRVLKPFLEVKESYPLASPLPKLEARRFSEIGKDPFLNFPNGVVVIFPCRMDGCIREYVVEYRRPMTATRILEEKKQATGRAMGLCEEHYVAGGRKEGLWT